jgi:hypothetical protein
MQRTTTSIPKPATFSFPFLPIGLLFIALSLLFSFYPAITRGWGLNYAGCFEPWVSGLFYILLLLFWLPPVSRLLVDRLAGISRSSLISFCRKHRYALFVLIGIAAGFCFRLLEIKYIFLGDTDDRVKQVAENRIAHEEFLTMQIIRYAYLFLHEHFGFSSLQTFRLFDNITGGIFIFISLCIADLIGNSFLKKAAVFVVSALSLAALLIFCGYTETYMMPALFLILYLYSALLYLKGKIRFFIPLLVLLIGIGMHLLLVSMLPSLIFLIYSKELWRYRLFRSKWTIAALALLSTPLIYMACLRYGPQMLLPLQSDTRMTMFSFAHYLEFFNSQMLGAGIGFLIWIATLAYSLIRRIQYDAGLWFFLIASLSITGMMFVFITARGSADWDISSFSAIVVNLSNAVFLIYLYDRRLVRNMKYGILMLAGFSLLHSSAWIYTNKTDASILWIESAFANDPADYYVVKLGNAAMLSVAFTANHLYDRALEWGYKACIENPNDQRAYYNLAVLLYKLGRLQEGNALMEESINTFPHYAKAYSILVFYNRNNTQLLYRILLQFEDVYRKDPKSFAPISKEEIQYFFTILEDLKTQAPHAQD